MPESHGFLRGLTSVVGFKTVLLPFNRDPRAAGAGKYNRLTGSLKIGFNGIVAFSDSLLRMMVVAGLSMAGVALLAMPVVAFLKAYDLYRFAQGVATMCIMMLFLGGIQLMAMGLLGAYVGRTYDETKRRPKFIVDESLGFARLGRGPGRRRPARDRARRRTERSVAGNRERRLLPHGRRCYFAAAFAAAQLAEDF